VSNQAVPLAPSGQITEVMRLTTASSASSEELVLPAPMRVFIMANVTAYKAAGDAAAVGNLTCRIRWAAVPSGSFTTLGMHQPSSTFPDVPSGTAVWQSMPLNARVDLPAGAYDFLVQCWASGTTQLGTAALTVDEVTMNVVAAAQ
jgi:hypothetical protein